ncbi:MAG: 2-amino-4-hydroxy-6-hydroxymethyldihydropteridine diphosphokinase [Pseudomonadota bacterium]|nr:2-amino-4-hydroxy-6-hydroxymethyldihydropteridine diphosphokinase [Pseudomonadota bacterium]
MIECYLGLGANQQDPVRVLHMAKKILQTIPFTHIEDYSPIIQTPPFGVLGQPIFYNQVIQILTGLQAEVLLSEIQKIEKSIGRIKTLAWGPRKIDIDILIYGNKILKSETLTLPHPQIWQRPFVTEQLQSFNRPIIHHFLQNKTSSTLLKHTILIPQQYRTL